MEPVQNPEVDNIERPLPANLESLPDELVEEILLNLPARQLIPRCRTSKRINSFCQSWDFWREKAFRDFQTPREIFDLDQSLTPQRRYFVFEMFETLRGLKQSIYSHSYLGNIRDFAQKLSSDIGALGDIKLLEYFFRINKDVFIWEAIRDSAVANEKYDMIRYVIDNRDTLRQQPHIQIDKVHFLIEAIRQDKRSVMQFIIDNYELDPLDINYALNESAKMGQTDLIEYFIDIGATNLDSAFETSVRKGVIPSILYFISKDIEMLDKGLNEAIEDKNISMIRYFLDHGPNPYVIGENIERIRYSRNDEILELLRKTLSRIIRGNRGYGQFMDERNLMIDNLRKEGSMELPTTDDILENLEQKDTPITHIGRFSVAEIKKIKDELAGAILNGPRRYRSEVSKLRFLEKLETSEREKEQS